MLELLSSLLYHMSSGVPCSVCAVCRGHISQVSRQNTNTRYIGSRCSHRMCKCVWTYQDAQRTELLCVCLCGTLCRFVSMCFQAGCVYVWDILGNRHWGIVHTSFMCDSPLRLYIFIVIGHSGACAPEVALDADQPQPQGVTSLYIVQACTWFQCSNHAAVCMCQDVY